MKNKSKSIFEAMMSSVTKLPWLKATLEPFIHLKDKQPVFTQDSYEQELELLKSMSVYDFEPLLHEIFKQRGFTLATKNDEQDSEIDLVLMMNNQKTYVQYKQWKDAEIDVKSIAKLHILMDENKVRHGMVISLGTFSPEAMDVALGKTLLLINAEDLSKMIYSLSQMSGEPTVVEEVEANIDDMPELEPLCPICSREMIKRTAKKGKNAGNTFWGCSQFPNCRGIISK